MRSHTSIALAGVMEAVALALTCLGARAIWLESIQLVVMAALCNALYRMGARRIAIALLLISAVTFGISIQRVLG